MSCEQDTALNTLRTTKYALNVDTSLFTTVGRSSGNNIIFKSNENPDAPTYDEYKMRRKAEVLKYNNNISDNNNSNKMNYANIVRGNTAINLKQNSTQNFIVTNPNTNNLTRRNNSLIFTNSSGQTCDFNKKIFKSARNSGVPSNDLLFEDVNVPFQTSL